MTKESDHLLPFASAEEAADAESSLKDGSVELIYSRLTQEAKFRDAHIEREKQRMLLRKEAYSFAVGVCAFLGLYVGIMALVIAFGNGDQFSDQAQLAIFGTPVVAIATITIFVLRGVFSGFHEKPVGEDLQAISQMSNFSN